MSSIGAVRQETIAVGEDEGGNPSIYFLSRRGPYRAGVNGVEYMGTDIEDLWVEPRAGSRPHTVYYPDKHQVWFCIPSNATGASADRVLVFDTRRGRSTAAGVRGGWSERRITGSYCATLFANTIGSTMSVDLKPYYGTAIAGDNKLHKADTGTTDGPTTFQAYVITQPKTPAGLGANFVADDPYLHAAVSTGVTIQVSLNRDFGAETLTGTCLLTAAGTETRVQQRIEDLGLGGCGVVQAQIGDAAAVDSSWTLDALIVPNAPQERR